MEMREIHLVIVIILLVVLAALAFFVVIRTTRARSRKSSRLSTFKTATNAFNDAMARNRSGHEVDHRVLWSMAGCEGGLCLISKVCLTECSDEQRCGVPTGIKECSCLQHGPR